MKTNVKKIDKDNFKPINVSWMITNRCNYNCEFCFGAFEDEELDLTMAKKVVKKLAREGLKKISWAGGEPLLWPGLMKLIKYTQDLGIQTMLISNGELITDEVAKELKLHLDWINLPLEGSTSKMNDLMTRKKGHFQRVIRLLKLFQDSRVNLKINTVASALNVDDITNMVPIIKKYGVKRWKIFQFFPVRGRSLTNKNKFLLDTDKFMQLKKRVLGEFDSNGCMVVFETNEELEDSYFSITPGGLVYVSQDDQDVILGDLKTQTVKEIWQHPALDKEKYWKRSKWVLEIE